MIIKQKILRILVPIKKDSILLTGDQIDGELKGYIKKINREKNKD